jgi:hypothetical protein
MRAKSLQPIYLSSYNASLKDIDFQIVEGGVSTVEEFSRHWPEGVRVEYKGS